MTNSFTDILSRPMNEVEAPKALPSGTYLGIIQGQFRQVESREKKTPGAEFTIALQRPHSDVDETALAVAAPEGLQGKTVRWTVYVGDDGGFFLKSFLNNVLGIDENMTLGEALANAPGRQLLVTLKNQPDRTGQRMVHFPDSVAAV